MCQQKHPKVKYKEKKECKKKKEIKRGDYPRIVGQMIKVTAHRELNTRKRKRKQTRRKFKQ